MLQQTLFVSKLFATCYWMLLIGMDLAIHVLGEFVKGLVVSGDAVHFILL